MKKYSIIIIASFYISNIVAQTGNKELVDIVNASIDYFPKLDELQKNVDIQEQKIEVAKTYLLPAVNLNAGYTYLNPISSAEFTTPSGLQQLEFQPNNNFTTSLALNYTVLDFGRAKAAIDKTKQELQLSKDNLEYNKTQVAAQVATIYYGIIFLQKSINVEDSVLVRLNENKKIVESKIKNGDGLQLDLYNINSNIDAEKNKITDIENQLQKQFNLLAYVSGVSNTLIQQTNFDFSSTVTLQSSDVLLKNALENNYDFKLIEDKISIAQQDLQIANKQFAPIVNINAATGFKNGYQPDIYDVRFNYAVGVNLSVPLYNGGRMHEQYNLNTDNIELNRMAEQTLQANYKKDIEQVVTDIQSLQARMQNMQSQIEQTQEAYKITESRYKNGIVTHIELINAVTNVERTQLSEIQLEYQSCLANVELTRLIGIQWWVK